MTPDNRLSAAGRQRRSRGPWAIWLTLALCALAAVPARLGAHDIPDQILLSAFVKPESQRLHMAVRIPLVMFLNMNFPKRGPGFLALEHMEERLMVAAEASAREILLFEDGTALVPARARARISQPSDRSFESYATAIQSIDGPPLPPNTNVFWNQGYVDTHVEYPIRSRYSSFSLDFQVAPGLRDRIKLALRFLHPNGSVRAYDLHPGTGLVVLDPRWFQAAATFVKRGGAHILNGLDHLLFLACLVAPFRLRHMWRLVGVVTSFTVAHSVTLLAAAFGLVPQGDWFPPLIETLIAVSILYMAIENVFASELRNRWRITALFGLVHGFGFSFVLEQDLQFAGSHLLLSLLSFNVGVEIGQLLFLIAVVPMLGLLSRAPRIDRYAVLLLSIIVGHTAWHWTLERFAALRLKQSPSFEWSEVQGTVTWVVLIAAASIALLLIRRYGIRSRIDSTEAGD